MTKQTKCTTWGMRAAQADKAQIAQLAKRLGVKESEAVRRAVVFLLSEKSVMTATKTKR